VPLRRILVLVSLILLLGGSAWAKQIKIPRTPHYHNGKIVFSYLGDIWVVNEDGSNPRRLTVHTARDIVPRFSPDGKWLVYSSVGEQYAKLYRLNLANPTERYQLTTGDWNDIDAYFSPDGKRLFFASDKQTGRNVETASAILENAENAARTDGDTPKADLTNFAAFNIYSLDLETGDLLQYTDVIGGCFSPVVFTGTNNKERMVFSSYYKGQWRMYSTTTDKPLHAAEKTTLPSAPILAADRLNDGGDIDVDLADLILQIALLDEVRYG